MSLSWLFCKSNTLQVLHYIPSFKGHDGGFCFDVSYNRPIKAGCMLVQGSFCRKQKLCFLCGVLVGVEIPSVFAYQLVVSHVDGSSRGCGGDSDMLGDVSRSCKLQPI